MELTPFIVFALPRSMTAWTSCFLTCGPVTCQHELFLPRVSAREVAAKVKAEGGVSGIADPGALLHWRELMAELPTARVVYLARSIEESQHALAKWAGYHPSVMNLGYERLQKAQLDFLRNGNPFIMDYKELQTEFGARMLWQHVAPGICLPESHLRKMLTLHIEQHPKMLCENSGARTNH